MDWQTILLIFLGLVVGWVVLLGALAGILWWKIQRSPERQLGRRIAGLDFRDKLSLAFDLFVDRRVPPIARIITVALVLYLAMPLDLIPDFIPVLGFLDDFLVVLIGAAVVLRTVPPGVIEEHVSRYEYIEGEARPVTPKALPGPSPRR